MCSSDLFPSHDTMLRLYQMPYSKEWDTVLNELLDALEKGKDHYDSAQADRHLAETVKMMIFKLELKHMYVWDQHHGGDRVKFYVSFGESPNR